MTYELFPASQSVSQYGEIQYILTPQIVGAIRRKTLTFLDEYSAAQVSYGL